MIAIVRSMSGLFCCCGYTLSVESPTVLISRNFLRLVAVCPGFDITLIWTLPSLRIFGLLSALASAVTLASVSLLSFGSKVTGLKSENF